MNTEENLHQRNVAADYYSKGQFTRRVAFQAGWDSAMQTIGLVLQTPGGDGCYCAHHPDDPAHTKDCYDLMKALTGK